MKFNLGDDYKATTSTDEGTWTMVYDVGFSLDHKDVSYFAYNKYVPDNGMYKSKCGETLVGWYNNKKTNERGCYKASKVEDNDVLT